MHAVQVKIHQTVTQLIPIPPSAPHQLHPLNLVGTAMLICGQAFSA